MSFCTVASSVEVEQVIKGSRFVARVLRVRSVPDAMTALQELRDRHADATHNCWAYRLGDDYRFSDDGEPGGTAGRPMLEVLARRDLQEVLAVVTRYYGGTKLGAGGLVRAYGGTLAKALDAAGVTTVRPRRGLRVGVAFADMDGVHRLVDGWAGLEKEGVGFDEVGMQLHLSLFDEDLERFAAALTELTRGGARIEAE